MVYEKAFFASLSDYRIINEEVGPVPTCTCAGRFLTSSWALSKPDAPTPFPQTPSNPCPAQREPLTLDGPVFRGHTPSLKLTQGALQAYASLKWIFDFPWTHTASFPLGLSELAFTARTLPTLHTQKWPELDLCRSGSQSGGHLGEHSACPWPESPRVWWLWAWGWGWFSMTGCGTGPLLPPLM